MKTSINFKAVKKDSEIHNFRHKIFDYIRKDLVKNNEYWSEEKVASRLLKIEDYCKEKSGRKLQKNAMPIREAVVVIKENTTMFELQNLAERLKKELGIHIFQIAIHKDEGHYDTETGDWIPNYHAHLVADWQDKNTGKTLKHKNHHYSKMQDLAAECLSMERGVPGTKKRLDTIEFKLQQKENDYQNLVKKIVSISSKLFFDKNANIIVTEMNDEGKEEINLEKTIKRFENIVKIFKASNDLSEQKLATKNSKIHQYENQILDLMQEIRNLKKEYFQLISNPKFLEQKKSETEFLVFNLIEKHLKYEIQKRQNSNWDSQEYALKELSTIYKNLVLKNGIPFTYLNAVFAQEKNKNKFIDMVRTTIAEHKQTLNKRRKM